MIVTFNLDKHNGTIVHTNTTSKHHLNFNQFRLDIFYELDNGRIFFEFELMINDERPSESKILNYMCAVDLSPIQGLISDDTLLKLVKELKHNEGLLSDFRSRIQTQLRRDFTEFNYVDLESNIGYFKGIHDKAAMANYNSILSLQNRLPLEVKILE